MWDTERRNENTMNLDKMSTIEVIDAIQVENMNATKAVAAVCGEISTVVDAVYERMKKGGRLFYIGCGTSGRLGVLDASECPPTYGVSKDLVIGIIAGGDYALRNSVEGSEDNFENGKIDLAKFNITDKDSIIGISVAGGAKYVLGAIELGKNSGALTVCLASNKDCALSKMCDYSIITQTGAEVVTGSTRMKAGTAHKMVLNMISTAVMVKLGYVYENLMINLRPLNEKLKGRMIRITSDILHCTLDEAEDRLNKNNWIIKEAIK